MAGPTSGNTGDLKVAGVQFCNLLSWNLVRANDVKAFTTNKTAPNQGTLKGNSSWNINFVGQLEDGVDVDFNEGDLIALELINTGSTGSPVNTRSGDVRVNELETGADIDAGDAIIITVSGIGNLAESFASAP